MRTRIFYQHVVPNGTEAAFSSEHDWATPCATDYRAFSPFPDGYAGIEEGWGYRFGGNNRNMRYEIFWSNNNFILSILQRMFSLRGKSKAGKYILSSQFGKIGDDFVVSHSHRQPAQHVRNRDARVPNARLAETLGGINLDNILISSHVYHLKNNAKV
jgi:hypothetical protein